MYPLTVRVNEKRVVVIGGGKVAGFKIIPLLKFDGIKENMKKVILKVLF